MSRKSYRPSCIRLARQRSLVWLLCLGALVLSLCPTTAKADEAATPPAPLLLILDASGSMWGQVDGENKIVIARRVLSDMVAELPEASTVGVVAYGHRREGDCQDIETLIPLGPLDRQAVGDAIAALNPKGKTPITGSLEHALEILESAKTRATVVLLSDGLETCGGDPCGAVRAALEKGAELVLHVVGFDVSGEDLSQLQCMAQAGHGLFLTADHGDELADALDAAMALPVDVAAGRLVVHATADGELQDVAVLVSRADDGSDAGGARTYASPDTNPTAIPLADGEYSVKIQAVGMKGDTTRHLDLEIRDGAKVEHTVDFSTAQLSIGVRRNGELSDATYKVYVAETREEVASGRTYAHDKSNPAVVRLTTGRYDVEVQPIEIKGSSWVPLGQVELTAQGQAALHHDFPSGTLRLGARQGSELVDATVHVYDLATGEPVAQGRTYTADTSNPKVFEVAPGRYRVQMKALKLKDADRQEMEIEVTAGAVVDQVFDF